MAVTSAKVLAADEGPAGNFEGAVGWLNSAPINIASLRGKVVLVDFWTYSCINSLRNLPYIKAWAAKYKEAGLVVIGAHTPEFLFEHERSNVEMAARDYRVTYPVAIDSNSLIWKSFANGVWPADYVIDGKGRVRHHHFGEGDYPQSERVIQDLLKENGATNIVDGFVTGSGEGIEAPPNFGAEQSYETYVGYNRFVGFASPEHVANDVRKTYSFPQNLARNHWALSGSWTIGGESAALDSASGKVTFRFHSRDLHLILTPPPSGVPVHFRVTLNGVAPGPDHGADVAPDGSGTVRQPRLYQLVRQKDKIADRTFVIEFFGSGVKVFDFTFG